RRSREVHRVRAVRMGVPRGRDLRRGRGQHARGAVLAGRALRPRVPDHLPALHLLRPVHRGVPDACAHDDQRVRAREPRPWGPHLREAGPAGTDGREHARRTAPDGARHGPPRLLPRGGHGRAPRAGRVGRREAARRPDSRSAPVDDAAGGRPMTSASSLVTALTEAGTTSSGEATLFWVLAPLMVLGALGLLFSRRTIHVAVSIAGVMVGLAILYVAQEAFFLGFVQIVVYTGAIMMLFLFVLMLVGVDASDSLVETISGQRWIGLLAGLGTGAVLVGIVTRASFAAPVGLEAANTDTNPVGVSRL